MADKDFKFYVLKSITGKEKEIEEYILRMREIEPLFRTHVREILIPMETYLQANPKAKSGKVERVRPYYSGYVFVEACLEGEVTHLLRRIPNVLGFLGGEKTPEILSPFDVAQLKEVSDRLKDATNVDSIEYTTGERVKVTFGPFAGFYGDVVEVSSERKKLKIMVKVFGRETMMDVDYAQVDKEVLAEESDNR